jgi:hypothetical protein
MNKWIQAAIPSSHKGDLHRALGIPLGKKIPDDMLERTSHESGHIGQMARLARTLKSLGK